MKLIAIATLGCKTNQFESASMIEQFIQGGYQMVPFSQSADIYVINSCTVTARTDAETRRLIRRARRLNPEARIIATGCYAQVAPEELEHMPEVNCVLGNREKQIINSFVESEKSFVSDIKDELTFKPLKLESFSEHTRAFLQAQNGCNSFCAYCIVPYARGRSRSVSRDDVLQGVRNLALNGYQEVVLTGIHLGAYGLDLVPVESLESLVQQIDDNELVHRLRIGSVEPNEISDGLISLMSKSNIICPHLHLPLQSGSDTVLSRMGRKYSISFIRDLIGKINSELPHAFIGADIIAGFPGESEDEFNETLQIVEELPFSSLHVFPFSRRPGTRADKFPNQINGKIITNRAKLLRNTATLKKSVFYQKQVGKKLKVLVQKYNQYTSICEGISRNYVAVKFSGQSNMINTEQIVQVDAISSEHVIGHLINMSATHLLS